ncbi:MAG: restriction endonuclease subunit M [Actinomycetota bacterium]|nr:MAG: restriction endonuclease subunit M [Actinomycetota bacterium]
MIKYIGSKRLLVPHIVRAAKALGARRVLDLFSGTARVGHALKREGFEVTANDHLTFAYTLAKCYVEADARKYRADAERLVRHLDEVGRKKPRRGYFTENFCVKARFFHPKNGARIDAIREEIARLSLDPTLEAIALVSLMEAADRVDSTVGVQMAYLKEWAPRALDDLKLRVPEILPGPGTAWKMEAKDAAAAFEGDLAYLDPPYNQHSYMGNYHIWETLVRWDKPETYGVAKKRIDCKAYKSPFNSRKKIGQAFRGVLEALRCPYVVVSFNDEGYLPRSFLEAELSRFGHVEVVPIDFPRYVGAKIGIYNPEGRKVGKVKRLRNIEYLFLAGPEESQVRRAAEAAAGAGPVQRELFHA